MGRHSKKQVKKDKKKGAPKVDEGKIRELGELEERVSTLSDQHRAILQTIRREEIEKRKNAMVLQQVEELLKLESAQKKEAPSRFFESVGRVFLLSSRDAVVSQLKHKMARTDAEIPRLKVVQAQYEVKMKQESDTMRTLAQELKKMKAL